jgi:hypothetical protein
MGLPPARENEMAIAEGAQERRVQAGSSNTIASRESAYVEATVEGQLVTYRPDGGLEGFSHPHPMPAGIRHREIMEAVILEIAAGRGEARGRPFSRRFARRMIRERRAHDGSFPAKHAEAAAVEALLETRPDLFRA